ncbi:hypothetical protein ACFL0Q_02945 [Thermodesulfobacteriota bacterium]
MAKGAVCVMEDSSSLFPTLVPLYLKREAKIWAKRIPKILRITLHPCADPSKWGFHYVLIWDVICIPFCSQLEFALKKTELLSRGLLDAYKFRPDNVNLWRKDWEIYLRYGSDPFPECALDYPSLVLYDEYLSRKWPPELDALITAARQQTESIYQAMKSKTKGSMLLEYERNFMKYAIDYFNGHRSSLTLVEEDDLTDEEMYIFGSRPPRAFHGRLLQKIARRHLHIYRGAQELYMRSQQLVQNGTQKPGSRETNLTSNKIK